jgi:predicted permease
MFLETFLQDIRIGLRVLVKERSFCLLAVAVLGIGISAVVTQFSIVDGTLLRGLPFHDGNQLVDVQLRDPSQPIGIGSGASAPDYLDFVAGQSSFQGLTAYLSGSTIDLTVNGAPRRYTGSYVTDNFFGLLGVKPMLGRDFQPGDNRPGAARVTILGHAVWERDFGSDPDIVGKALRVNGASATVVGVMPPGFEFPASEELWVPLFAQFPPLPRGDVRSIPVSIIGRLRAGVAIGQARNECNGLARAMALANPRSNRLLTESQIQPFVYNFVGPQVRSVLYVMLGAVAVVLLIACVNIMNMQLARATLRSKELAVRGALGATRVRLVRQMLTEGLLLAAIGAGVGVVLSRWAIGEIDREIRGATFPIPYWIHFELDGRILAFVVAITMFAAVLSSLLPALMASRANASDVLKESGRGNTGRFINASTRVMVVGQIALTCALLILSALMTKSILNQQTAYYGYDGGAVLTARLGLFQDAYPTGKARQDFFAKALRDLRADPSVASAALTSNFRMTFSSAAQFEVEGRKYAKDSDRQQAAFENVSDGYFSALGIRVLQGREFRMDDSDGRRPVAIVNEEFARKHFAGLSPIGRRIRIYDPVNSTPWRTIVGLVPDTLMQGPFTNAQVVGGGFFVPLAAPFPPQFATVIARPRGGPPDALAAALRRDIARVDPDLPIYFVGTPNLLHDQILAQSRIISSMFTIFGFVGVVLASVGLYGVMSFAVNQRRQEFGIRMALGADHRKILGMVMRQGAWQLAIGLSLGIGATLALAIVGGSSLGNVFFHVNPRDPAIYVLVAALLSAVAGVACWVPARRAAGVDPMAALRTE